MVPRAIHLSPENILLDVTLVIENYVFHVILMTKKGHHNTGQTVTFYGAPRWAPPIKKLCVRPWTFILSTIVNVFILLNGWICLLCLTKPALSRFLNAVKIFTYRIVS